MILAEVIVIKLFRGGNLDGVEIPQTFKSQKIAPKLVKFQKRALLFKLSCQKLTLLGKHS